MSVYGTDTLRIHDEDFLGSMIDPLLRVKPGSTSPLEVNDRADLPARSLYELEPTQPVVGWIALLRPSAIGNTRNVVQEY